ncbi:carboxylesterase/lipase family protein [Streptomyces mirabilis]|uniref:carboxylesterase/lipase family protein n=1 Tax=Streptomyces mirabilis TaxID=68239 RepID=UPI00382596C5
MTSSEERPEARTVSGSVRGRWDNGTAAFHGIPYAASPVGALRFAGPQPASSWSGVREATTPGPAAPQPTGHNPVLPLPTGDVDEHECLTANVWSPDLDGSRPVLLWLYGGGYLAGSGAWTCYDGAELSRAGDIVVVTVNYRVGPLGYLYLAGLSDHLGEGNFGLLDQIAALRWVRENIAAFGGDPNAITVGGQSAGAMSAVLLMAGRDSRPLFQRALLESPPLVDPTPIEEATRVAESYLDVLGLAPGSVGELRSLPWQQLVDAYIQMLMRQMGSGNPAPPLVPVLGGAGIPESPLAVTGRGETSGISVLAGTARDERNLYEAFGLDTIDKSGALGMIRDWFGSNASEAYEYYDRRRQGATPWQVANDAITYGLFERGTVKLVENQAQAGNPGYLYRFDWQSRGRDGQLGSPHCIDLPFLFGNHTVWGETELLRDSDPRAVRSLTAAFQAAVTNFVRTGSPNGPVLPSWEAYEPGRRATMRFDTVVECVGDLAGPQRALGIGSAVDEIGAVF